MMNSTRQYVLKLLVVISFFAHVSFAVASAPAPVESQNIHEVNEKLQELKKKYEQASKKVSRARSRLVKLMNKNRNNKELLETLEELDPHFKEIERLASEKLVRQDYLKSSANISEQYISLLKKDIGKLIKKISIQYGDLILYATGSSQDIASAIEAKIEMHKGEMTRYELRNEINNTIKAYKRMRLAHSAGKPDKVIVSDDLFSEKDSQYSSLKSENSCSQ